MKGLHFSCSWEGLGWSRPGVCASQAAVRWEECTGDQVQLHDPHLCSHGLRWDCNHSHVWALCDCWMAAEIKCVVLMKLWISSYNAALKMWNNSRVPDKKVAGGQIKAETVQPVGVSAPWCQSTEVTASAWVLLSVCKRWDWDSSRSVGGSLHKLLCALS